MEDLKFYIGKTEKKGKIVFTKRSSTHFLGFENVHSNSNFLCFCRCWRYSRWKNSYPWITLGNLFIAIEALVPNFEKKWWPCPTNIFTQEKDANERIKPHFWNQLPILQAIKTLYYKRLWKRTWRSRRKWDS